MYRARDLYEDEVLERGRRRYISPTRGPRARSPILDTRYITPLQQPRYFAGEQMPIVPQIEPLYYGGDYGQDDYYDYEEEGEEVLVRVPKKKRPESPRPKTGPMRRVLDDWFEDDDYAPGGRLIADKRQHANWQGNKRYLQNSNKHILTDIHDNAATARERQQEEEMGKHEQEESIKRNLHVWGQWRTMVNDVVSDPDQVQYSDELLPEFDVVLNSTSAVDNDDNIHEHDPVSLMRYSVTTNAATSLDPEAYLNYGVPRAKANTDNVKMRHLYTDAPSSYQKRGRVVVRPEPPPDPAALKGPLRIPRPIFDG